VSKPRPWEKKHRDWTAGDSRPALRRKVKEIEAELPSCLKTRRAKPGDPLWEELSGTGGGA
jgi:hypothetical protein